METTWIGDRWAVTVSDIDFLDPAEAHRPDARERGVRLEVRPVTGTKAGSVYASQRTTLEPGVCRIDLLESAPGAADRMHWHPTMSDGEPGERTFDESLSVDPLGWLAERLADVRRLLPCHDVAAAEVTAFADLAPAILDRVRAGLDRTRRAWPDVRHDERGLAAVV